MIELTGCREKRQRLLPARVVVYFVLGLCLPQPVRKYPPFGAAILVLGRVMDAGPNGIFCVA